MKEVIISCGMCYVNNRLQLVLTIEASRVLANNSQKSRDPVSVVSSALSPPQLCKESTLSLS